MSRQFPLYPGQRVHEPAALTYLVSYHYHKLFTEYFDLNFTEPDGQSYTGPFIPASNVNVKLHNPCKN